MTLATALRALFPRSLLQHTRPLSTTFAARGLEEFFDTPVKEGEKVTAGEDEYLSHTVKEAFHP